MNAPTKRIVHTEFCRCPECSPCPELPADLPKHVTTYDDSGSATISHLNRVAWDGQSWIIEYTWENWLMRSHYLSYIALDIWLSWAANKK